MIKLLKKISYKNNSASRWKMSERKSYLNWQESDNRIGDSKGCKRLKRSNKINQKGTSK